MRKINESKVEMEEESKEETEEDFECEVPEMAVESTDETFPEGHDKEDDTPSPTTKPSSEDD
jgi:hypothetical protein